jgi:hypothetical protein
MVAYVYAADRKAERPDIHLGDFSGILQVDGHGGYTALAKRRGQQSGPKPPLQLVMGHGQDCSPIFSSAEATSGVDGLIGFRHSSILARKPKGIFGFCRTAKSSGARTVRQVRWDRQLPSIPIMPP